MLSSLLPNRSTCAGTDTGQASQASQASLFILSYRIFGSALFRHIVSDFFQNPSVTCESKIDHRSLCPMES